MGIRVRPKVGKQAHHRSIYDAATASAQRTYRLFFGLSVCALSTMVCYLAVRLQALATAEYRPAEAVLGIALFAAELFLMVHSIGYFASVVKASRYDAKVPTEVFSKAATTPVAVLVAIFNESEHVVDETLAAIRAMDYPAINLYLLDDSTDEVCSAGAARLAERYGAQLRHRVNRAGYKAGAINDVLPEIKEEFIAILDADQRPIEGWLKDVVPLLESNPKLAFVQAPQTYVNLDGLPVARATRYQQAVFFEHICEGKGYSNAMFCCGSNVVFRRAALLSVETLVEGRRHYFDETSVTEDFATSLRLHQRGWETAYVNQPYVLGMGPETVSAYFTQHMRWALGTFGIGLRVIRLLFTQPRSLTFGQWWEYLVSGTYYFVGYVNFVFIATPIAFLLFGLRPFQARTDLYLLFFIPYMLFSISYVFLGMTRRKYPARGLWLAMALTFSTSWIYVKASSVAILGLKRAFAVTPKGVGGAIPLSRMPMETFLFALSVFASGVGVYHLIFVAFDLAYIIPTIWTAYQAVQLSTLLFYFNRPVTIDDGPLMFERASLAA
jgi:cellulose synthase (UDP-forming)